MTYNEVSKAVGFMGSIPFPDVKSIKLLCSKLAMEPDLETYMHALRIYRFSPVAKSYDEKVAMLLLREVLFHAKESLWGLANVERLTKSELGFLNNN